MDSFSKPDNELLLAYQYELMEGPFFSGKTLPGVNDKEKFKSLKALKIEFDGSEPGHLDQIKEWYSKMNQLKMIRNFNCGPCGKKFEYERLTRLLKGLSADPKEHEDCHLCINQKKILERNK
jgi:hypothetical protein